MASKELAPSRTRDVCCDIVGKLKTAEGVKRLEIIKKTSLQARQRERDGARI